MSAITEDDDAYHIVDKGDGVFYVAHGFREVGPFFRIRRAEKWIAEDCEIQRMTAAEATVIKKYNSEGQLIYDATHTARR